MENHGVQEGNIQDRKKGLKGLLVFTFIVFSVLFVGSVSFGLTPEGVRELNNWFFSLFIHDDRKVETLNPNVSLQVVTPVKENKVALAAALPEKTEETLRIAIPKISLSAGIQNPSSSNMEALNNSLLYGPVRYPVSGVPGEAKNILIFGHSSNLPVVYNQNFKIFNGLKLLSEGDEISLYRGGLEYRYRVKKVELTLADDARIVFSNDKKLILSTCNTLGAKEERYVVEADFVGSYPYTF